MSRSLVTNMRHFLDENGVLVASLPIKAKKLAENIGHIISMVTQASNVNAANNVACWRLVSKKRCAGKIYGDIDLQRFDILWHCLKCGDHGCISNWQNTCWDGGKR